MGSVMRFYDNAHNAIRDGNGQAPAGIAFRSGKGWFVYDLRDGLQDGDESEFVCIKFGVLPIPVSDVAKEILHNLYG